MATNVCDTVQVVENMSFLIYIRLNVNYRFNARSSNVIARASKEGISYGEDGAVMGLLLNRYAFASSANDGCKRLLILNSIERLACGAIDFLERREWLLRWRWRRIG